MESFFIFWLEEIVCHQSAASLIHGRLECPDISDGWKDDKIDDRRQDEDFITREWPPVRS